MFTLPKMGREMRRSSRLQREFTELRGTEQYAIANVLERHFVVNRVLESGDTRFTTHSGPEMMEVAYWREGEATLQNKRSCSKECVSFAKRALVMHEFRLD